MCADVVMVVDFIFISRGLFDPNNREEKEFGYASF
jgi:hypothetical protein